MPYRIFSAGQVARYHVQSDEPFVAEGKGGVPTLVSLVGEGGGGTPALVFLGADTPESPLGGVNCWFASAGGTTGW